MEPFVIVIVLIAVLGAVALFIRAQTRAGGKWGIGKLSATCPRCGSALPSVRMPKSAGEFLWGGWTCPTCGCAVDKYGRERV